jgi:repressor LexA
MKNLHPKQQKLLKLLIKNADNPLTYRELMQELETSSKSVVAHHIDQLEKKGYLKRNPHNPRDYTVLENKPEGSLVHIPMYGLAQCGPKGSCLDGDPVDKIPIASKLVHFPANKAFLIKAKGDSMTPLIKEGDLILGEKNNNAKNGDIVICVNNQEALIKIFQKDDNKVILSSYNSKFEPFIAKENFRIEGIVKGIISYNLG